MTKLDPPIFVTDGVAKSWLEKYRGFLTPILNAGKLELQYGDRLRALPGFAELTADGLVLLLRKDYLATADKRVCHKWLTTEWSTSGRLLSTVSVEEQIGVRLRLDQYKDCFQSDEAATALSQTLAETQPSVHVSALLLRQWFTKYHPSSGPVRYSSAEALDAAMGDELRGHYPDFSFKRLVSALGQRRKVVIIGHRVARTWIDKFRPSTTTSSSASSSSAVCLRRPATRVSAVLRKRPAASVDDVEQPPAKRQAIAPVLELSDAHHIEQTCGDRYRTELTDLGLGMSSASMAQRLLSWGFRASGAACKKWLSTYRLGTETRDGNVAILALSRQDLQRWYYVEGIQNKTELQKKYIDECGVYYEASNLVRWVTSPAQALPIFNHNEDVHGHACGEYVLDRLQRGAKPEAVAQEILERYLVISTPQRLQAYRTYREATGNYWNLDRLEEQHWAFLYEQVSLDNRLGHNRVRHSQRAATEERLLSIRTALCARHVLSEETHFHGNPVKPAITKLVFRPQTLVAIFRYNCLQSRLGIYFVRRWPCT